MPEPRILLVLSGKGGVGKSSVTTQLALSLTLAGRSVGVLDIDLTGPSIPRFLRIEDKRITQGANGLLPVQVYPSSHPAVPPPAERTAAPDTGPAESPAAPAQTGAAPPPAPHGSLHAISLGLVLPSRSTAVIWRGPKKTAMVRQFLESTVWPAGTDYVLVDTPPGTSDEHISLLETILAADGSSAAPARRLAGAVVVTTPQAVAVADVRKSLDFCSKTGVPVRGIVENMAGFVCPRCGTDTPVFGAGGGRALAREAGLAFLGSVPIDPEFVGMIEGWDGVVEVDDEDEDDSDSDEEPAGNGQPAQEPKQGQTATTAQHTHAHAHDGEQPPADASDRRLFDVSIPLVERYSLCSLAPIFSRITAELLETIES